MRANSQEIQKRIEYISSHPEMSVDDFALLFGVSTNTIKNYMNNKEQPGKIPCNILKKQKRQEYVRDHPEMNIYELAEMFDVNIHSIRKDLREIGRPLGESHQRHEISICWDCENAIDFKKCCWVDNFVVPNGALFNDGAIVECPNFIRG